MSKISAIQWTDATWNPARGCTKVDKDCMYCYMMRDSMDGHRYDPHSVVRTKTVFDAPLQWQKQRETLLKKEKTKGLSEKEGATLDTLSAIKRVFTSSLTDIFHPAIDSYRNEIWDIIRQCPEFTFQILTKRPERIAQHLPTYWSEIKGHVWLGTSVGSPDGYDRIRSLCNTVDSDHLFLSLEPLWAQLPLIERTLPDNIKWVIVGGESGNDNGKYRYRPCELDWISAILDSCRNNNIPVFVKQLGTHLAKQMKLSDRHGGNIEEFPEHLRIREFPKIVAHAH